MKTRTLTASLLMSSVLAVGAFAAACVNGGTAQAAPRLKVLFPFTNIRGQTPHGSLIADSAGNLYGATLAGGTGGTGVVFELSPPVVGKRAWTEKVLQSFASDNTGYYPNGGLLLDRAGNLYGTAQNGGTYQDGLVFRLSPPAMGKTAWTETVLFSFAGANGNGPESELIADRAGNLYGTTTFGGPYNNCNSGIGCGVVFELSPPVLGKTAWTETPIHSFDGTNGRYPSGGLVGDGAGNLYGSAGNGGAGKNGLVFELSPPPVGKQVWYAKTLLYFNGTNGSTINSAMIMDGAGSLYGMTETGGAYNNCLGFGCGLVFKLSPPVMGKTAWTETVLISFDGTDGQWPFGGVIADGLGNLYGTTQDGGTNHVGSVFKLSPPVMGKTAWTETVLFSFAGANGHTPFGGLLADGAGNHYGVTYQGGAYSSGVAYSLTP